MDEHVPVSRGRVGHRIAHKAEMNAERREWIGGPESRPQRACVQAALAPGTLVEITVIAARR